jgi:hypothetical protein
VGGPFDARRFQGKTLRGQHGGCHALAVRKFAETLAAFARGSFRHHARARTISSG